MSDDLLRQIAEANEPLLLPGCTNLVLAAARAAPRVPHGTMNCPDQKPAGDYRVGPRPWQEAMTPRLWEVHAEFSRSLEPLRDTVMPAGRSRIYSHYLRAWWRAVCAEVKAGRLREDAVPLPLWQIKNGRMIDRFRPPATERRVWFPTATPVPDGADDRQEAIMDELLGTPPPKPTSDHDQHHEAGIMGELLGITPQSRTVPTDAQLEPPVEIDLGMPRYGQKPEGAWAGTSWRPAKHNPRGQMLFTTIMAAHPDKVRHIYERFTPMQRRVFHLHFFGLPQIADQPGACGKPMTLEEIGDFFLAIDGRDKTTKQAGANIQKIMRRCRADFARAGLPDPLPRATMPQEQSLGELAKTLTVNQTIGRDDVIRDIDQATCRLRSQLQAANAAHQKREAEQRERDRKALFGAQNPKKQKFLQKRMPKGFKRPIRHRRVGKTRHQP